MFFKSPNSYVLANFIGCDFIFEKLFEQRGNFELKIRDGGSSGYENCCWFAHRRPNRSFSGQNEDIELFEVEFDQETFLLVFVFKSFYAVSLDFNVTVINFPEIVEGLFGQNNEVFSFAFRRV